MQFNILAEGLSSVASKSPPLEFKKPSVGGGFDALKDPTDILDFSKRRVRVVEEILRCSPSLISLQECDHYQSFFKPVLEKLGYKSTYQAKRDSPCLQFGYYSDGVALFWKSDEFALVGEARNGTDIRDVKVPHCIVRLEPVGGRGGGRKRPKLIFATTHLKSKSSAANEEVRRSQIERLCGKIRGIKEDDPGYKVILAGDFNADPVDQPEYRVKAVPQVTLSLPFLTSCYPVEEGGWSTWKRRGEYEAKHMIDYIFVEEGDMEVGRIWGVPKEGDMMEHRLPCWRYPSDHVSIAAEIYCGGGEE
ncbi:hypothetical protein TrRE_jg5440 [Triparma retinervis]|uniref:Endonuclease/exonuclease/phosphatase domain-containing protein n=1 Tax=Triparma retinervis TaxID=2557542 RepID=A0A9W7CD87_9STRA|nr:hypothetical protein TrRE_jg5440 [Triparma retinervis]